MKAYRALCLLPVLMVGWPASGAFAQRRGQPPVQIQTPPVPRQGTILDVSADPTFAALPVTRLTVDIDKQPAQKAIQSLSLHGIATLLNDAGNRGINQQTVTMHLHDVPFMEGLMEFRQQIRARVISSGNSTISLGYQPTEEIAPWSIAGPFAVQLLGIANNVDFGPEVRGRGRGAPPSAGEPRRQTVLRLAFSYEPQLTVLESMKDIQFSGLEDDKQQAISFSTQITGGQPFAVAEPTVSINLVLPQTPGRSIPLLKGTIDAKVAETEHLVISNLMQKQTLKATDGMTIEVSPIQYMAGSMGNFTLMIQYGRGELSAESWAQIAPMLSVSKPTVNGFGTQPIRVTSPMNSRAPVTDTVLVSYSVNVSRDSVMAGDATLDVPTTITDVRVPFEFKDVFLP